MGGATSCEIAFARKEEVSMPHAALWVVQHVRRGEWNSEVAVSMPHAALWVVQP